MDDNPVFDISLTVRSWDTLCGICFWLCHDAKIYSTFVVTLEQHGYDSDKAIRDVRHTVNEVTPKIQQVKDWLRDG